MDTPAPKAELFLLWLSGQGNCFNLYNNLLSMKVS